MTVDDVILNEWILPLKGMKKTGYEHCRFLFVD